MLRVKNIKIENINGIRSLELPLNDGINIICGPNGIGKSTIVECIVGVLMYSNIRLTRTVNAPYGLAEGCFQKDDLEKITRVLKTESFAEVSNPYLSKPSDLISSVMYFQPSRLISYQLLNSIERQEKRPFTLVANDYYNNGIPLGSSKNWLAHQDLYFHYPNSDLTENNKSNLKKGKEIFSVLDNKVKFSRISKNNDVMVETPSGIIPMEYLSSGYQASVLTLLAIIRELEARSDGDPAKITDFDGVVIIDEIDVHLHPTWQARILDGLRALLPKAQIILTTHSPHIIQSARANEVIPLEGENGHLRRREVQVGASGFQGWTVEEILRDVMGLTQTRPAAFTNLYEAFDTAVQNDDLKTASGLYSELEQMLHPTSELKTILKLHLDSLGGVLEPA